MYCNKRAPKSPNIGEYRPAIERENPLSSRQAASETNFFYKEDLEKLEQMREKMRKEAAEKRAKLAVEMEDKEPDI